MISNFKTQPTFSKPSLTRQKPIFTSNPFLQASFSKKQQFTKNTTQDTTMLSCETMPSKKAPKTTIYETMKTETQSTYDAYSDIHAQINQNIADDNQLTKTLMNRKYKYLSYQEQFDRIATSGVFQIPSIVTEIYLQQQQKKQDRNINFVQGFLEKTGFLYYCVEKKLILLDCNHIIEQSNPNLQNKCQVIQIDEILTTIKQFEGNPNNFNLSVSKQLLIFSHPWQLRLHSYHVIGGKFVLNNLEISININCQRVKCIDYDTLGNIYYLDELGSITIAQMAEDRSFLLIPNGKLAISRYKVPIHPLSQLLNYPQTKSLWKKAKYFFSYFYDTISSIFRNQCLNLKLFCDSSKQIVATLNDYSTGNSIKRKKGKIIHLYTLNEKKPTLLNKISQEYLIEEFGSQLIHSNISNLQIYSINKCSQFAYSNVQVIFKNGIKMYINVTHSRVILEDIIHPPDYRKFDSEKDRDIENVRTSNYNDFYEKNSISKKSHSKRNTKHKNYEDYNLNFVPFRQTSQYSIISQLTTNNCSLNIIQSKQKIFSYLTTSRAEPSQRKSIYQINWNYNMNNQAPIESYLYQMPIRSRNNPRQLFTSSLQTNNLSQKTIKIQNFHEFARQVNAHPSCFIYATNSSFEIMTLLRPVDIVFSIFKVLEKNRFEEFFTNYWNKIHNWSWKKIVGILIQIYCDSQGVYYVSEDFQGKLLQLKLKQKSFTEGSRGGGKVQIFHHRDIATNIMFDIVDAINSIIFGQLHVKSEKTLKNPFEEYEVQFKQPKNDENLNNKTVLSLKLEALIQYYARVVNPFWKRSMAYLNFNETLKISTHLQSFYERAKQLLVDKGNIYDQAKQKSFYCIIERTIQILNFCSKITQRPNIAFYKGVQQQKQQFQPYIFICFTRQSSVKIIQQWNEMFPSLISKRLKTCIKIYLQLREIQDQQQKKQKLIHLAQNRQLPRYFLQYFLLAKQYRQMEKYLPERLSRMPSKVVQIPHLKSKQQEIEYVIKQIQSSQKIIEDRIFLINYAQNIVKNHKKDLTNISKYENMLDNYKRFLRLQQVIVEFCEQIEHIYTATPRIYFTLVNQLIQYDQLKQIVHIINNPAIFIIFYNFFDPSRSITCYVQEIINYTQAFGNKKTIVLQQTIQFIFLKCEYKVPLKPFFTEILQQYLDEFKQEANQIILNTNLSSYNSQKLWIIKFFYDLGVDKALMSSFLAQSLDEYRRKFHIQHDRQKWIITWSLFLIHAVQYDFKSLKQLTFLTESQLKQYVQGISELEIMKIRKTLENCTNNKNR